MAVLHDRRIRLQQSDRPAHAGYDRRRASGRFYGSRDNHKSFGEPRGMAAAEPIQGPQSRSGRQRPIDRARGILGEYALPLRPKRVVWLFYEGNDFINLVNKLGVDLLVRYLDEPAHQRLRERSDEITPSLLAVYREMNDRFKAIVDPEFRCSLVFAEDAQDPQAAEVTADDTCGSTDTEDSRRPGCDACQDLEDR